MRITLLLLLMLLSFLLADPRQLLGKTYIDVMHTKGFPNAIFPIRQATPDRDDIVFNYEFSYYYFYNSQFYRVFYAHSYLGEILPGLKIADNKAALTKLFGQKYSLEKDGLVWQLDKYIVVAKMDEKNRLYSMWFIMKVAK